MADFYYTQDVAGQNVFRQDGTGPDMAGQNMAGQAMPGPDGPLQARAPVFRAINMLGAVASMALIVGVGVWGYKLLMRDVSGIPVVRALEGPMRLAPDDPGGSQALNQGLAVNTVTAQGTAAPTADRLVLAPRPVRLTDEDAPMVQLAPDTTQTQTAPASTGAAENDQMDEQQMAAAAVNRLVAELTRNAEPLPNQAADSPEVRPTLVAASAGVATPEALELPDHGTAPVPEPAVAQGVAPGVGLGKSLRPVLRPARAGQGTETVGELVLASAPNPSLDVDPDSLAAGTRLAQLGAFDTPEIARAEWNRLNIKFADYLTGKSRVIQQASSGGRTFYRLRAMGFDDISEARQFCSVLQAAKTECIPVTTR